MRALQVFSSRFRVPAIVAVLLACSLGSAQAAVEFVETCTPGGCADAVIHTFVGDPVFPTHYFTVSEGGIYRATITDLSSVNPGFFAPIAPLEMTIADVETATMSATATVIAPETSDFVEFIAAGAGSFAALVKATPGSGGSGYQVRVTLIPEPAVWLMLAAGLGLLGFVRIRRAANDGV